MKQPLALPLTVILLTYAASARPMAVAREPDPDCLASVPDDGPAHSPRGTDLETRSRLEHGRPSPLINSLEPCTLPAHSVTLVADARDDSANGLPCFQIVTPAAVYFLERSGGGLSSMLDRDGVDWIGFHPQPGSGAGGEYRGFPNAVHQQQGSYFHPRNAGTDPCRAQVASVRDDHVAIHVESDNGLWAGRYDFFPTHCTFTMTRLPRQAKYWVLYEGTPGGAYNHDDWWMTSSITTRMPLTVRHEGDIPSPEWVVFGDAANARRCLFLKHHQDDAHPDRFYQMQEQMTVFGFGRSGLTKHLDGAPESFSIGFLETTDHAEIGRRIAELTTAK